MTERELYQEFGRRLRELREKAGLTQDQIAKAIGLTRTSVTNIEAGRQSVDLATLYSLADALDVWPADLLVGEASSHAARLHGLPGEASQHVLRFLARQAVRE